MNEPTKETLTKLMRFRLKRLIRGLDQIVIDIEWWNANRTEHPPFDCEGDRVAAWMARKCLAAIDAGQMAEAEVLSLELLAHCKELRKRGN